MPQIKLVDETGKPITTPLTLVDESGTPLAVAPSPTLLKSRQEASKGEFEANLPQSTVGTRAREAAIGALSPFDLRNVPGMVSTAGSALFEALTGKGSAKGQEMIKAAVMAPIEPLKDLASGDPDRMAHGAGGFLSQTVPAVTAAVGGARQLARPISPSETPAGLYKQSLQRGLKPSEKPNVGRRLAQTGLEHQIPVSEQGVAQLKALIDDLEAKIDVQAANATARGVTVDKFKVASRLNETTKKFGRQATPQDDLAAISEKGNQFLEAQPAQMAADVAQDIKKGTYQQLKGKYGKAGTAQIEAEKALARGIKEELARQVPEIADLTAQQAKLLQLDKVLELAVNRAANSRGSFLKDVLTTGVATTLTGSSPAGLVAGVLRHVWSDPAFKSRLAIAVNQAQQNNPGKWGKPSVAASTARVTALVNSLNPVRSLPETERLPE